MRFMTPTDIDQAWQQYELHPILGPATAVQLDTDDWTRCPTCDGPLEDRGPFDGRQPNSGVTGGHQGFGTTVICEQGHWWTWIQGKLVGPSHILTVVEL